MPRVRRFPPVRLAAPPEAVRATAVAVLGASPIDDHTIRVPVVDRGLTDVGVDLVLRTDDGGTVASAVGHGRIDIPFFRWAFRPLVAISQRRTARYAIARLRAELEGAPAPVPPKPVMGLPTANFTPEQATHLASAAAAVVGGFVRERARGSARRADLARVPRLRHDVEQRAGRDAGRRTARVRGDRARRPRRAPAVDPHRHRRVGGCLRGLRVLPESGLLHRRNSSNAHSSSRPPRSPPSPSSKRRPRAPAPTRHRCSRSPGASASRSP